MALANCIEPPLYINFARSNLWTISRVYCKVKPTAAFAIVVAVDPDPEVIACYGPGALFLGSHQAADKASFIGNTCWV